MPAQQRPSILRPLLWSIAALWALHLTRMAAWHAAHRDLVDWFGLRPRTRQGLAGIVGAHFFHADWTHLAANTLGMAIVGWLALWYSRRLTAWAAVISALAAGAFTWLVGSPDQIHIGASGVIFGLLGFVLANAVVRRGCIPVLIAIPVLLLYGTAMAGMLPGVAESKSLSWQMHLGGFCGGAAASWWLRDEREG